MKSLNPFWLAILLISFNSLAVTPNSEVMQRWFAQPTAIDGWHMTHHQSFFTLTPSEQNDSHGEVYYAPEQLPCIVSVPHRFHDKHTLTIGTQLFKQACQLLVTNTKHRYDPHPTEKTLDYAKQVRNIHTAAISGFVALNPTATVFQIHGFSQKKRKTTAGKLSEVILSQGKQNNETLWKIKSCLVKQGYRALIYPQEVKELGGTQNVVHQLALPAYHFVHIELSYQIRKQLINNNQQLEQFSECVQSAL
ncbi:hypothetical protein [Pseudoalteromonas piscicida]|uniref:Uncharacterized protein n=1 Tax=Pseudoalteromonas piscicida TaxID=43662 RepID=A0A2A5JQN1_PSEO7|nr:hypothetical protein [Pseudoalteromonas piscicida]PCK31728.1 hypothetical protein CEX98_10770 [Pseudoalteromonas piscicida]